MRHRSPRDRSLLGGTETETPGWGLNLEPGVVRLCDLVHGIVTEFFLGANHCTRYWARKQTYLQPSWSPGLCGRDIQAKGRDEPQTAIGGTECHEKLAMGGAWRCLCRGRMGQWRRALGGGDSGLCILEWCDTRGWFHPDTGLPTHLGGEAEDKLTHGPWTWDTDIKEYTSENAEPVSNWHLFYVLGKVPQCPGIPEEQRE